MNKRTALFEEHQRLGANLINFGGWDLPVYYSSLIDEHLACRDSVGLFDVSHMGEIHIKGGNAEAYLNFLTTNDVSRLSIGQAQYTVMCHENGGIVDDLIIYRRAPDLFLLVVNANNTEKDFVHINSIKNSLRPQWDDVEITDDSLRYSQIAIQGRNACSSLNKIASDSINKLKPYSFVENVISGTIPAITARTGYTGEDGFEIYVPWDQGPQVWRALLEAGSQFGIKPCGLGARDTLRLEMKYPLYGNELTDQTSPLETGLTWVVKLDKKDFLGKASISQLKTSGVKKQLIGIRLSEKGIPRHGYSLYNAHGNQIIGVVTSGTYSPSLNQAIAIAIVDTAYSKFGTRITVEIRGSKIPAEVVPTPFYNRSY